MAITGDKTLADIKAEESIIDKVQWAKDLSIKHKKSVLVAESFAPTTSADWVAVPSNKSAALDELAERVADVEDESADVDELIALSGVAAGSEDLGSFTGTTIPDDQTIKQALQALETEVELKADDDAVVHLTGAEVVESKSLETSCEFVDVVDNTKALVIDLSNQTTAVDVTLDSGAQTVATTVALPVIDGSDTFVMAALAQVIESKALETSCEIVDVADNTKTLAFDLSTQSTGVDVTINVNAQTVDCTFQIPAVSGPDTFVMADVAQILKAKSLDSTCSVVDAGDNGKVLSVDLSGATTATETSLVFAHTANRDVSFPDASGEVSLVVAGAGVKQIAKATIGFAELNAATTGVAAVAGPSIPVGAYVTRVYFDVTEAFVGDGDSGSTVSIGIQDQAVDVQAAAAVSGAPFDATGLEEGSVGIDGTVTKYIAISASAKQISATWTAAGTDAALTAGSVTVWAEFIV